MTTPPSDPFGTPREGDGTPTDRPSRDPQGTYGQQPQQGQAPGQPQYGQQYGSPGYDQPGYGQQYGAPVQGAGAPQPWQGPPRTETKAIIALVCAIASWVVLPLLPAIAALMIGTTARREIAQSGGRLSGDGLVTAAKVIAWLNIALCVLGFLLLVLAITVFSVSSSDVSSPS